MKRRDSIRATMMLLAPAALLCGVSSAYAEVLQSGTLTNGYDKDPGAWFLHVGEGTRIFRQHVEFPSAFPTTPTVVASLSGVDAEKDRNLRIVVEVENVTPRGFDVRYSTWADSHIYTGWVSWTAHSP